MQIITLKNLRSLFSTPRPCRSWLSPIPFATNLELERAQQQDFADPATMAQWGKELGANLMLFRRDDLRDRSRSINSRVVNYVTTLFLTDMETNKRDLVRPA
jgi:hypothetical protein